MSDESEFADKLAALCAKEMRGALGDGDRAAAMVERLLSSLAFTIAIACKGDSAAIDEMLTGAEGYLAQAAAGYQKAGAMFGTRAA